MKEAKQNMDNILQPKNKKNHQLTQTHKYGMSFRNTDTLQQPTKPKIDNIQEQDKSRIYEFTCKTCLLSYIGQMSRSLKQSCQEHTRHIKHNKPQLAYVLHILNIKDKYAPINNTMTLLKHIDKTTLLLSYEQLYNQS
jgi:hypothetical protein